jgi:hypothetical protein
MRTSQPIATTFLALLATLGLQACDKQAPMDVPAPPPVMQGGADATPTGPTSVPPAASVISPASQSQGASDAAKTQNAMTPAQESNAMPLPGQNNDHSLPTAKPGKAASAP